MGSLVERLRERNKDGKLDNAIAAISRSSLGRNKDYKDEVEDYYPERNKEGNGSAIIRFLPGLESEYHVELFQHGFSENGKWYIENCPATLGRVDDCPACAGNRELKAQYGYEWDKVPEDIKKTIKRRGNRSGYRAGYYSNILVIKDPANPENEGKVFRFRFGKAILDKIVEKFTPEADSFTGITPEPIDVFDLKEGCNFRFIITKKDGRANYDKSMFEEPSPCPKFNEEDQFPLLSLISENNFKSREELYKAYKKVMGEAPVTKSASDMVNRNSPAPEVPEGVSSGDDSAPFSGDDADNLAYFQQLAEQVKI